MGEVALSEVVWERRECVSADVEDSVVLLDLETLVYHSLNSTAAAVWEMLAEPATLSSIVAGVCGRYDVPEAKCAESIEHLLKEMETSKLIQPKAATALPASV